MVVYVLDFEGNPLMPIRRFGKVRRMLRSGKALVVNYEPFTIKLNYQTTSYIQDVTLGVDAGSIHVGLSATTKQLELFSAEVDLRSKDIKKLLDSKRESRRTRRGRKRYRKPRFNNRTHSKKKGWLAPSMQHRIDSHIRLIEFVCSILPVKKIIVEIGNFDTQKISNPDIESEEYQQGLMTGFDNVKAFVKWRDGYRCRQCNGKSGDNKLEIHHIQHREDGGSDRPDNLVCLCHTCHDNHHNHGLKLKKFSGLEKKNAVTLRDAAAMNIIKDRVYHKLRELHPDKIVWRTFGYITSKNRRLYNIEKGHRNDAYVISRNFNAKRLMNYFLGKQFRRHNRKTHKDKILSGGRLKRNQAEYLIFGFAKNDRVRFDNQICFIHGRRSSGYFDLRDLDGRRINDSALYKKIQRIKHENSIIFRKLKKASADSSSEAKDFAVSSAQLL